MEGWGETQSTETRGKEWVQEKRWAKAFVERSLDPVGKGQKVGTGGRY